MPPRGGVLKITQKMTIMSLTWAGSSGAGEGNRTLMTSLEGCGPQPFGLLRPRSGHVRRSPWVRL